MWTNARNNYDSLGDALERIGIPRPTACQREVAIRDAMRQFMEDGEPRLNLAKLNPEDTVTAILDVATQSAARQHTITKLQGPVEDYARQAQQDAYTDAAPAILDAIRAHVASEVQALTKASEHLETTDTAQTVIDRGPKAIAAWKARGDLAPIIGRLDALRDALSLVAELLNIKVPAEQWLVDCTDAEEYDQLRDLFDSEGVGSGWLAVLRAGHDIEVADPADLPGRVSELAASRQALLEAQREAARQALPDDGFVRGITIGGGDWRLARNG